MKNLRLPLKKQWFEMTNSDGKTEEYREITPYWFSRLFEDAHKSKSLLKEACDGFKNQNSATYWNFKNGFYFKFKKFDYNVMTLGYPKSTDTSRIKKYKHLGIEIRTGNPDWGAEPDKLYFVIKHGEKII